MYEQKIPSLISVAYQCRGMLASVVRRWDGEGRGGGDFDKGRLPLLVSRHEDCMQLREGGYKEQVTLPDTSLCPLHTTKKASVS